MSARVLRLYAVFTADYGYKIFKPVLSIGVSFSMTTYTQSNAVFGNSIVFHIIDVMNYVSIFFADSAGVVISRADHVLKVLIKGFGVFLIPAAPMRRVFATHKSVRTFIATKLTASIKMGLFQFKGFAAKITSCVHSFLSMDIMTCPRTKTVRVARIPQKGNATMLTFAVFPSAFPENRSNAFAHRINTSATARTKTSRIISTFNNFKFFFALFANPCISSYWLFRTSLRTATSRTIAKFRDAIRMYRNFLAAISTNGFNSLSIRASHCRCP